MQNTTNLGLKKPDYTDFADIQDINDNMDTIDDAIHDTQNSVATFTSSDVADGSATSWTSVTKVDSGETHKSIFAKMSQMFKNVRYLYKMLGTTDISAIGNGTVTGGLSSLNSSLIPTLLWTNPDTTHDFDTQDVTIPTGYKYLIFTFKGHKVYGDNDEFVVKCSGTITTWNSVAWVEVATAKKIWSRNIRHVQGTVTFGIGTQTSLENPIVIQTVNERLIPMHIYGVNSL